MSARHALLGLGTSVVICGWKLHNGHGTGGRCVQGLVTLSWVPYLPDPTIRGNPPPPTNGFWLTGYESKEDGVSRQERTDHHNFA